MIINMSIDYLNKRLFVQEILEVCKKHNLILIPEDWHGGLLIEEYNELAEKITLESAEKNYE